MKITANKLKKTIIQLQKFFNFPLRKLDYYNAFDFYNEKEQVYIELKRRRCQNSTYESTMVPIKKINKAKISYTHNDDLTYTR